MSKRQRYNITDNGKIAIGNQVFEDDAFLRIAERKQTFLTEWVACKRSVRAVLIAYYSFDAAVGKSKGGLSNFRLYNRRYVNTGELDVTVRPDGTVLAEVKMWNDNTGAWEAADVAVGLSVTNPHTGKEIVTAAAVDHKYLAEMLVRFGEEGWELGTQWP
jgi:hypothetical protein